MVIYMFSYIGELRLCLPMAQQTDSFATVVNYEDHHWRSHVLLELVKV